MVHGSWCSLQHFGTDEFSVMICLNAMFCQQQLLRLIQPFLMYSVHLTSIFLPLCLTYTWLHWHWIWYIPWTFTSWPSLVDLSIFFFFFRWRCCPLWALACRTIPLHLSLSITNSLHLLTPKTWRSLSTSSVHPFLGLPLHLVTSISWVKETSASVQFISKKEKQNSCWGLPRTDQISMPRACVG